MKVKPQLVYGLYKDGKEDQRSGGARLIDDDPCRICQSRSSGRQASSQQDSGLHCLALCSIDL